MQRFRIASIVILLIVFIILLVHTGPERIRHSCEGLSWGWALLAPALNLVYTWIESARMTVILSCIKKGASIRNAFVAVMLGFLGNTILPFRFGDGARAYILAEKEKVSLSASLSTVMVDRIADCILFFVLVVATSPFYPFPASLKRMVFLAGCLAFAALAASTSVVKVFRQLGERFGGKLGRKISEEIGRFALGFSMVKRSGKLAAILSISVFIWFIRGAIIWVMFKAFHLDVPFSAVPVTLIFLNLGIALVNTPGNLGGFEVSVAAALKLFSVDAEIGLSYGIALHLIEHVPIVLLGALIFWFGGYKAAELGRMEELPKDIPPCEEISASS